MSDPFKFWFVYQPDSRLPRKRHRSLASAFAEANRLAAEYPGRRFYVLEALGWAWTGMPVAGEEPGPVVVAELGPQPEAEKTVLP